MSRAIARYLLRDVVREEAKERTHH
uniref:30S ribosomal protein S19 n=1 Tax=Haemonchus contortus TaxID=6289 RepID=A0A7I4YWE3_HAECO